MRNKHDDMLDAMRYMYESMVKVVHIITIRNRIWAAWQCLIGNAASISIIVKSKDFYKR